MEKHKTQRIQLLREKTAEMGLDAFLILVQENRYYFSGFRAEDGGFDESAGALLITDGELLLLTDFRFVIQGEKEAEDFEIVQYTKGLSKTLPKLFHRLNIRKVGFEKNRMSLAQYEMLKEEAPDVEFVGVKETIESIRAVKQPDEIQKIKNALALTETVFLDFKKILTPGMTEKEAAWELEKKLRDKGAEGLSFPVIAAFGPNSAMAHAVPGDTPIKEGIPLLFDFGIRLDEYCSDITRTLVMGEPDDTFLHVYDTVKKAAEIATKTIKPGLDAKIVDAAARDHINNAGYKGKFGHSLGHGVGIAVHEYPKVGPVRSSVLEPGMVFTVEPGVYLPGWGGIRLENMVLVTETGAEILNGTDFSHTV